MRFLFRDLQGFRISLLSVNFLAIPVAIRMRQFTSIFPRKDLLTIESEEKACVYSPSFRILQNSAKACVQSRLDNTQDMLKVNDNNGNKITMQLGKKATENKVRRFSCIWHFQKTIENLLCRTIFWDQLEGMAEGSRYYLGESVKGSRTVKRKDASK